MKLEGLKWGGEWVIAHLFGALPAGKVWMRSRSVQPAIEERTGADRGSVSAEMLRDCIAVYSLTGFLLITVAPWGSLRSAPV